MKKKLQRRTAVVKSHIVARLEVVIPCHNEAETLRDNIEKVVAFLAQNFSDDWYISIVDSGSTDDTRKIAQDLAHNHKSVKVLTLDEPGRGLALRMAIRASRAEFLVYMDEDLSTDLEIVPQILEALDKQPKTFITASRFMRESVVRRSWLRRVMSIGYSWLARIFLSINVKDLQCGCKGFRVSDVKPILAKVQDNQWFFDTELFYRARQDGYSLVELPAHWQESSRTSVRYGSTIYRFLRGLNRLAHERSKWRHLDAVILASLLILFSGLTIPALLKNGWANSYYTAAALAGAKSWQAFFFGGFDMAGYISVDKPPLAIWVSALSVRILGTHGWAVLLPHVLAGIATMAVVYVMVRRYFGTLSAWVAGVFFAFTPIAVVVFRYNNPDAVLTLCLTLATYAFLRTLERPSWRWSILAGSMVGAAFMTKMLQALIVVPVFIVGYFMFAKPNWRQRWRDLIVASSAFLIASLWWPIVVWVTPASSRPYIGGTVTNNIWELIVGYNGLNRLLGKDWYQPTGELLGAAFGGHIGILRFFNEAFGSVIAWALPLALLLGGLLVTQMWQARASKQFRAVVVWLLFVGLHILTISFTKGTIHPHYAVVIAPMVASLVAVAFWYFREIILLRDYDSWGLLLGILIIVFSASLLPLFFWKGRVWPLWIVAVSIGLAVLVFGFYVVGRLRKSSRLLLITCWLASLALIFAPAVSSLASAQSQQSGFIISAEPLSADVLKLWPPATELPPLIKDFLEQNRGSTKWIATSITSYDVSAVEISTGQPAMAIGGFSGVDNPMSLNEFIDKVKSGEVRYFIVNRRQSSEVRQCGLTFRFDARKENNSRTRVEQCDVAKLDHDEKSSNNIAVWAQQHSRIGEVEFKDWEIYDLSSKLVPPNAAGPTH